MRIPALPLTVNIPRKTALPMTVTCSSPVRGPFSSTQILTFVSPSVTLIAV